MLLAALGLALSIGANFMALAGIPIPGGKSATALGFGIFVVWLPTVLVSAQMTRHGDRKDFWKMALAGCPAWMRWGLYGLIGYGVLNFVAFIATASGGKHGMDTPQAMVRGASGHWMIFYGIAFAVLYSKIHAEHLYRRRKCPQGHVVSPTARFCPECGQAVSNEAKDLREP